MDNKCEKKSPEEVILFKGALKQKLKCLSASFREHILFIPQSPLLSSLNQQTPTRKFFLLSEEPIDSNIIEMTSPKMIDRELLLVGIEQCANQDLSSSLSDRLLIYNCDINIFINPEDRLASERSHTIVNYIYSESRLKDLAKAERWGHFLTSIPIKSMKKLTAFSTSWYEKNLIPPYLRERTNEIFTACNKLFDEIDQIHFISDGSVVTHIVEGIGKFDNKKGIHKAKLALCQKPAHSIVVNSSQQEKAQIAFTHNLLEKGGFNNLSNPLQCFIVVINRKKELTNLQVLKEVG